METKPKYSIYKKGDNILINNDLLGKPKDADEILETDIPSFSIAHETAKRIADKNKAPQNVFVCPNCKRTLAENEYEETTRYHNFITGVCRLCGHEEHWSAFIKTEQKENDVQ